MSTFKVGAHNYSTLPMTAMQQFHLARKLGAAAGLLGDVDKGTNWPATFSTPFILAAGLMRNEDCDFIVNSCLAVTRRMNPNLAPQPLLDPTGQSMFSDLSMKDMLGIVAMVLEENLGGFFEDLRSRLLTPKPKVQN